MIEMQGIDPAGPPESVRLARRTLGVFALLMLAWTCLWLLKSWLDGANPRFAHEHTTAAYWLVAKLVVWIAPALVLLRMAGRSLAAEVNLVEWRRWVAWGALVGLLIAVTGFARKAISGAPLFPAKLDYATLNVLLIAPLFEEFLIRAAVMGNLVPACGFVRANVFSSLAFVVLHIPGWYMMGSMADRLTQPLGGVLSIFLLGLGFGWATRRGGTFLAGAIAHWLNNFAS